MPESTNASKPGAPRDVKAAAGDHEIKVSWKAPASHGTDPITEYSVKVYKGKRAAGTAKKTVTTGKSIRHATITGLTNGDEYTATVRAKSAAGLGAASGGAHATPRTKPSAPHSLTAKSGDAKVTLAWAAPSSDGGDAVDSYHVDVYQGASATGTPKRQINTHSTAKGYSVTGLTNGTKYTFTVRATNAAGTGSPSNSASATPATTPHPVPTPTPTPHPVPTPTPTPGASLWGRRSAGSLPTSWRRSSSTRPQGPPRG
jgi:hypothetical protein